MNFLISVSLSFCIYKMKKSDKMLSLVKVLVIPYIYLVFYYLKNSFGYNDKLIQKATEKGED